MERRVVNPWQWQDEFGFSHAVEVSRGEHVLYCAGQTAIDASGDVVHAGDMAAQVRECMDNLEAVLEASGYDLSHVVRLNLYTTDVDGLLAHWEVAAGRLAEAGVKPAMTLLGVERLAFPELLVEIEATAAR